MKHLRMVCAVLLWGVIAIPALRAQSVYDSRNGYSLAPRGTLRILNLCINIIYDQTPERDPFHERESPHWLPGSPDRLNDHPPSYLKDFLDADYIGKTPHGVMTRLFYEASLGQFMVLGDFCVVNIRQSEITPAKPGGDFGRNDVLKCAISAINRLGGLQTVYGHNTISDFDMTALGRPGQPKSSEPNGKIDFVMVNIRNSCRSEEKGRIVYNYGQLNPGEGNSYESGVCRNCDILIGGQYYTNEITNVQNIGINDISKDHKNIAYHEFAHNLFGGNTFHTSGGNHFGTSNAAVFIGLQGGYGLMGGYNSSLVCCNGYERWRLGWMDTLSNPLKYPIAVNGENADIGRENGNMVFFVRDFLSTGDAIRIRFPYADEGAANQYLWLEYHRVGRNNKLDFLQYSDGNDCRQRGSEGIYAYIQVGRDQLSGDKITDVFSADETDNLRILTAKGNWDMELKTRYDTVSCIAWKVPKQVESYLHPNPLTGYNDLQAHLFDTTQSENLNNKSYCEYPWCIERRGNPEPNLPFLGDNAMAFVSGSVMDMSSNPPALNVVTGYTTQYNRDFRPYGARKNTDKIYLTGLCILMENAGGGTMKVEIKWDQYHLRNDVRWAGNILLSEKLLIDPGKKLWLDQGLTPTRLKRDTVSGLFTPPTLLSCESGSTLICGQGSTLDVDHGSTLIVRAGAVFALEKKSRVIIRSQSRVIIEKGAEFQKGSAKIVIKKGGIFVDENN